MAKEKVCTLDQLLTLRRAAAGRVVVHCHGCFDIVHPGHIQYLQFAKSLGDVLVVTVSADRQVNKGPNRPFIPDDLRARGLAALECVDAVYVNPHPTAVEILDLLRPDVYVKGREYETNHDPRFLAERQAVVSHGGRVVFSSGDVVYSSTALIDSMRNDPVFSDEKVRRYCLEHDLSAAKLANLVQRFRGKKMVVVGDYIQDRYVFCDAAGVASEGPMMSLRSLQATQFDGAAAVIALHLAGLGAEPTLVTALAGDEASAGVVERLTAAGVTVRSVQTRPQLVGKTRYLADQTKLFKVDSGSAAPLDSRSLDVAEAEILSACDGAAGIIFADFGYGMITTPLLERVLPAVRRLVPIVSADVSGVQGTLLQFTGVDFLCPTERELRQTLNNQSSGLNAVAHELLQRTGAKSAMITLGKQGLCLFDDCVSTGPTDSWDRTLRAAYLPAMGSRAVDPLGCGDALLATASLSLAAGGSVHAAAYLGSVAAGIEVGCVGNRPVDADELLNHLMPVGQPVRIRRAS